MAWCLCDWKPCGDADVYEQGSSVVYRKRTFEQTAVPGPSFIWQRETTELWRCHIGVFTNDRGGSRVDLRTAGYYVHDEERDTVRAALEAAEVEMDWLIQSVVGAVADKFIELAKLYSDALTARHPGLLARLPPIGRPKRRGESSPTDDDRISAIWQGTAVVTVVRDGNVYVNHSFLSPLQYCDRPTVRDVGLAMKTATAALSAPKFPEVDNHAMTLRSKELLQAIRDQMQTLGIGLNMSLRCSAAKRLCPPSGGGQVFTGPTLF